MSHSFADGGEGAVVRFGNGLADSQTEAQAAELTRDLAIALFKGLEDPLKIFQLDAAAGVLNFDREMFLKAVSLNAGEYFNHTTFGRKLDSIFQEIPQDLCDPDAVHQDGFLRISNISNQGEPTVVQVGLAGGNGIFDHLTKAHGKQKQFQFAAGNPGEIEQIINQTGFQFDVRLTTFSSRATSTGREGLPHKPESKTSAGVRGVRNS